jgi:hypothetical protein
VSSFLANIIRKGAGLPQEVRPRPSSSSNTGLLLNDGADEDPNARLKSEAQATFEDETRGLVETNTRARRPNSNAYGPTEASPRASKAAPIARVKNSGDETNEPARVELDDAAKPLATRKANALPATHAQSVETDAHVEPIREARLPVPRAAREPALGEQPADSSFQPAYANRSSAPEAVERTAAMSLESVETTEQELSLTQRAVETTRVDEEVATPESFSERDATRIVPRAQEPLSASIEPSSLVADTASRISQPEPPRVHVRIGTIEVRANNPFPPPPAPTQTRARRGLEPYTAARRYLDRKWY